MSTSAMAAFDVTVLVFGLICVMGAWDGLARRHIRFVFDLAALDLSVRGFAALLVGLLSMVGLVALAREAALRIARIASACSSPGCALHLTVWPVISTWQTALITLVALALFIPWVRGLAQWDGPYLDRMLAPGVWYHEREMMTLVQNRLTQEGLTLDHDDILRTTTWLRRALPRYKRYGGREVLTEAGQLSAAACAQVYVTRKSVRHASDLQAQYVVALAFLDFYLALHSEAARIWPFRARLLGY